jgi:hypothetical protein
MPELEVEEPLMIWTMNRAGVRLLPALLLLFVATPGVVAAQSTDATTEEIVAAADIRVKAFLDNLTSKNVTTEQTFETLLKGGPLAGKKSAIEALVTRSADLESRYGQFRASERIEAKRIGNDVLLLKYLYKCDNFPVVWYFTFYRDQRPASAASTTATTRNWSVIAVRFDTEIELLGL